ncbi:MAG: Gfo/Idh/MocA family oxidoreductase, partial [Candidatus Poribacteria bacterium]|nr:Gfo/Idh/MocA family oxidoreductase [Candidatus Poribacteria bacterium]
MDTIRWGILGTGNIAKQFARGLTALDDAKLVAVGSRTQESADKFADQFDAPRRHASYEALVNDPNVDAIYVATPHPFHCENTLLCIDAGKAVLCEKPFAINDAEAKRMIDAARSKGIFLMEAMWSRFFPLMVDVRRRIAEGEIGNVRMMTADFGFRVGTVNPKSRLFDPALGGGALLDVGVYPVSLASMVFGNATRIATLANLGETGVDEEAGIVLGYEGGQIAALHTAVRVTTPQ